MNNQNDNEKQHENDFGFDVDVMAGWLWSQNTTTAVFLLSKTPTTLFVLWQGLWQEFEVGIGSRKQAC